MGLSAALPTRCWWYACTRAPRPLNGLSSCEEEVAKRPDGAQPVLRLLGERGPGSNSPDRRRGGG
jgi:hypothetical protein